MLPDRVAVLNYAHLLARFRVQRRIDQRKLADASDARRYFAARVERLIPYKDDGLVEMSDNAIAVTPRGRLLIRNICMTFDRYSPESPTATKFSKVLSCRHETSAR